MNFFDYITKNVKIGKISTKKNQVIVENPISWNKRKVFVFRKIVLEKTDVYRILYRFCKKWEISYTLHLRFLDKGIINSNLKWFFNLYFGQDIISVRIKNEKIIIIDESSFFREG